MGHSIQKKLYKQASQFTMSHLSVIINEFEELIKSFHAPQNFPSTAPYNFCVLDLNASVFSHSNVLGLLQWGMC